MKSGIRLVALLASTTIALLAASAAADYAAASGYGDSTAAYQLDVSHDGYPRGEQAPDADSAVSQEPPDYAVIEVEEGAAQEVDGEMVIVVQEPEPVAATDVAPPPPRVAAVEQPVFRCPGGIWVDGYWAYGDGQYVWIDGHCVVERVNYVFVHPRWDFYTNVWWFVPGYYRPCGVWVGFGYYRPFHWYPPYHRPYYRGYRGVPVHRGVPGRPTVARPASRPTVRGATPVPRAPAMNRLPPTRASAVTRVPPTRAPVVNRLPTTQAPTVSRLGRSPTLTNTVPRVRPSIVSQPRVNPPRTTGGSRSPAVRQPSARSRLGGFGSRPSASPSRTGSMRQPSFGGRATTGMFGRPGGSARPSAGGFGGARTVPTGRGR